MESNMNNNNFEKEIEKLRESSGLKTKNVKKLDWKSIQHSIDWDFIDLSSQPQPNGVPKLRPNLKVTNLSAFFPFAYFQNEKSGIRHD